MGKINYIYTPRPPFTHPKLTPGMHCQGSRDKDEAVLSLSDGSRERIALKHVAIDRNVNSNDLQAAATHVAYEMKSIGHAFKQRGEAFAYTSWFVHCRNLMEFFAGNAGNDDDVYAQDYFDGSDRLAWLTDLASTPEPPEYDDYRRGVNKLAAHLTYSRAKDPDLLKVLPTRTLTEHFGGLSLLFLRRLSAQRTGWFGGLIA